MGKTINLISNIANGAGLEKDCRVLASLLEQWGHKYRLIPYDRPHEGLNYPADINLWVEVMVPMLLGMAPQNWVMPNSEWWDTHISEQCVPRINLALCKTHDCEDIWSRKLGGKTFYTGFEAEDLSQNVPFREKELAFLHLAGNSGTKNTEAVIECWRYHRPAYPITIVSRSAEIRQLCSDVPNVTYIQRLDVNRLASSINRFRFHLMPSEYEGYGQGMHEALGCGGIVITTNAPPMTEFPGIPPELLINPTSSHMRRIAKCWKVNAEGVLAAVERAVSLPYERQEEISVQARAGFESERLAFRERLKRLLDQ